MRKFRFHLSTALLLTIAAGALIGLNLRQRFASTSGREPGGWYYGELRYGFPLDVQVEKGQVWTDNMLTDDFAARFVKVYNHDNQWNVHYIKGHGILFYPKETRRTWDKKGITINALIALGILAVAGFCSEWMIRRRRNAAKIN